MTENEKLQMAIADNYGRWGCVAAAISLMSALTAGYLFYQAALGG